MAVHGLAVPHDVLNIEARLPAPMPARLRHTAEGQGVAAVHPPVPPHDRAPALLTVGELGVPGGGVARAGRVCSGDDLPVLVNPMLQIIRVPGRQSVLVNPTLLPSVTCTRVARR